MEIGSSSMGWPWDAVTTLAAALDRLGARIYHEIHVESSYIDLSGAPKLAERLAEFSACVDECLAALDDPSVIAALSTVQDILGCTEPRSQTLLRCLHEGGSPDRCPVCKSGV